MVTCSSFLFSSPTSIGWGQLAPRTVGTSKIMPPVSSFNSSWNPRLLIFLPLSVYELQIYYIEIERARLCCRDGQCAISKFPLSIYLILPLAIWFQPFSRYPFRCLDWSLKCTFTCFGWIYLLFDCKKKLGLKSIVMIENIYISHEKKCLGRNICHSESITSRLSSRPLS